MPIPKSGPVGAESVRKELGERKTDTVTLCTSSKINPKAKYKPYKFNHVKKLDGTWSVDKPGDLTDADIKSINYGMTPEGFERVPVGNLAEFIGKPWGQWQPPEADKDWCRLTDFAGYTTVGADKNMSNVLLYIHRSNDGDPMQPLENQYICAEMTLMPSSSGILSITDFTNTFSNISFGDMCFTLLFGGTDAAQMFHSGQIFGVQSAALKEYAEGTHILKLRLKVTPSVIAEIEKSGDFNMYCVCLCPELVFAGTQDDGNSGEGPHDLYVVDNPVKVTGIKFPPGGTQAVNEQHFISLNMWNDGFVSAHLSTGIGKWTQPAPSDTQQISAYPSSPYADLDVPFSSGNALKIGTNGGELASVIFTDDWQNKSNYSFTKGTVRLAVVLFAGSATYYGAKIIHQQAIGITTSGGKKCLQFSSEQFQSAEYEMILRGTGRDFNADVPKGTYRAQVGLIYEAEGQYYNDATNKTVRCVLTAYGDENAEQYAEHWKEIVDASGFFPDDAVYTAPLNYVDIVIS